VTSTSRPRNGRLWCLFVRRQHDPQIARATVPPTQPRDLPRPTARECPSPLTSASAVRSTSSNLRRPISVGGLQLIAHRDTEDGTWMDIHELGGRSEFLIPQLLKGDVE